ncbi:MAG: glycosyltransferase family 2 protein, partial [Candidatus Aegiribacteria sp.]|nr:glycosyltransferase family 2 protein [Candidatus Aegiribacteria sp.]
IKGIEPLCDIVISDNASSDATVKAAAEAVPGAKIIRNGRNGGFGYGNNRALSIVDTEYVLFLNSDASITLSSLEKLVSTLENTPDAAGVQPLIRLWGWPLITLSAGAAMTEYGRGYDFDFMHFQPFPDTEIAEVPCITAALSLFRTDALRTVGGFDENIFMYYEDIDLCLRLRGMGYKFLLEPESVGKHMMGSSSNRRDADKWELRSSAYLTRKFLGGASCSLPDYWIRNELRTRLTCMLKGRPWLWKLAALHRVRKMEVMHSDLPEEFLMHLLAPRPLRMPHPRSKYLSAGYFHGSDVIAGPGWDGNRTGSCGFGCICVPEKEGTLTLEIRSCNISGSVALWSNSGYLTRVFLNTGQINEISAELTIGERELYLVPDRSEQIIELENVIYTYR